MTAALLSPQFFQYISTTFSEDLISIAQARILLSDIASCSLMKLDSRSLDKLLDLMVMIFKWQIFLMSHPDDLFNITLRHLQSVGRLMPEILIDQANQIFHSGFSELNEEQRYEVVRKLNRFLAPFNIRISLLIRMKLQNNDASFVDKIGASTNDFFRYYIHNLGDNIYEKIAHFPHCQVSETKTTGSKEIDCLFQQFNVDLNEEAPEVKNEDVFVDETVKESVGQGNSTLDVLKKQCKLDMDEEAPPIYEDNFQDLLNLLDGNPT